MQYLFYLKLFFFSKFKKIWFVVISKVLDLIISIKWNNFYMCVWLWYLCQFSYKTTKICLLPFLCEQMWECVLCYSFHWWCTLPDFQLTARLEWKLYTHLGFAPYHPNSMYIHLGKGCTIWSYLEMHMLGKVLPFGLGYLSFCYLWKKLNEICLEIEKNIYLWWIWKTKHFIQEQLQLSLTLRWVEN